MKNRLFKRSPASMLVGMLTLAIASVLSAPAGADPIAKLNVIAADTIFAGGRPAGAAPLLDFAMVHAAIHDAVQAYEKRFEPYAAHISHATGSRVAAAAAAARDVLVNRFPAQTATIDAKYLLFLADHGLTEENPGRFVGQHAAAAIIERRAGDGSYPIPAPPPNVGAPGAGNWRPTSAAPFSAPWLGDVTPFTMEFNEQFRAPASTGADQPRIRQGLQRGESAGWSRWRTPA